MEMTDYTVAKREKMSKENVRGMYSRYPSRVVTGENFVPLFLHPLEMMAILGQRNNVGIPIILSNYLSGQGFIEV